MFNTPEVVGVAPPRAGEFERRADSFTPENREICFYVISDNINRTFNGLVSVSKTKAQLVKVVCCDRLSLA